MTLLEKCREEHPGLDEGDIISFLCPCDFGYEKLNDGCDQPGGNVLETCKACWNREAKEGGAGDGV